MSDTLSDKIVEAGARALAEDRWPDKFDDLELEDRDEFVRNTRACLSAALAAAEADGVVFARVPDVSDTPTGPDDYLNGEQDGWNNCRTAVLVGKVTL